MGGRKAGSVFPSIIDWSMNDIFGGFSLFFFFLDHHNDFLNMWGGDEKFSRNNRTCLEKSSPPHNDDIDANGIVNRMVFFSESGSEHKDLLS